MGFFNKKIGYLEILYQNIKVIQEIAKARRKKTIMRHLEAENSTITFEDARLKAAFDLYRNRFKTRQLEGLIGFLIKDMERFDFENTSSIPHRFEPQYTTYQNRYDKLSGVNLLSHTIRVFIMACDERRDMPDRFMEQVALLALAHDFGKNQKVIEIASEGKDDKHNQISAKYLGLIMRSMGSFSDDFIDSMCGALYFHHASNTKSDINDGVYTNSFIDMLNMCDAKAREHELKSINKLKLKHKMKNIERSAR